MWCILMNVLCEVEKNVYCNIFKCQIDPVFVNWDTAKFWTQGLVFGMQVFSHFIYMCLQPLDPGVFLLLLVVVVVVCLLCFVLVWFGWIFDRISLYSPSWPPTHHITWTRLPSARIIDVHQNTWITSKFPFINLFY
jgi:fluoride ion exporter CrcB/FEX